VRILMLVFWVLFLIFSCGGGKQMDIDMIIQTMSLEEKIDFIGGYNQFNIRPYEHLGIPEIHLADGPVGVRNFGKSTAYPASIALAASFDKEMAYKIGKAIGTEAKAKNCQMMLGPGMNIYRLPICGRNFEYLGEDPFLAGELAAEYTKGIQDQGVLACAKHYVANNQEFNRHHCSSDMDMRTLHEIYLPAFKKTVQEGKVATVMTAYNLINGIHASEHDYLNNKVLKGDWNFDGFIVSDRVSTYDGLACAKGGLDLEMPSAAMMNKETLIPAIERGELEESVIDDKVRRILSVYQRFDYFNNPDISKGYQLDSSFTREVAIDAARAGMVLLKNEENSLPLDKKQIKKIAVIGPNGDPAVTGGGGSSGVDPLHSVSLLDAVKKIAGEEIEVVYEKGVFTGVPFPEGLFENQQFYVYEDDQKVKGVQADFYQGKKLQGDVVYSKKYDKLDLADTALWSAEEVPLTNFSVRFTCFFTPVESGYYSIGGCGDDGYRIYLDGVEIVDMWRDQGPTPAKYDGFLNGGQEYKIVVEYYQSGGGALLQLGAKKVELGTDPKDYSPNAIAAAKEADLVIMAVGFDRTFEMPYQQGELINKIAKTNPNTIVVLNSGGNVEMESWLENVKALLMAWYPGGEGNIAAAEILFGDISPSGKLPASFEKNLQDNPCYDHYFDEDEDLRVFYGEGIFMGYRYWDQAEKEPRFPFGFGLSYTTFEYSGLSIDQDHFTVDDTLSVSLKVKNSGDFDGTEIVQLYVSDVESSLPRPKKELKEFARVDLKKGEEKEVKFTLDHSAFEFYNPETEKWESEAGKFEILIASSSADIRATAEVILK